jgi:hypothetical protein
MYFDTSLKTSRRDCSGISCHVLVTQFRNFFFFEERRVEACYSVAAVCDKTVTGRYTQRQGGWVGGYPQMRFLSWLLWKENKSHQFNSCVTANRSSHACRSSESCYKVAHSSGSALASHVLQKGVAHGAREEQHPRERQNLSHSSDPRGLQTVKER